MKFVPVPGTRVLFSIWETRVQDYLPFGESAGAKNPAASGLDKRPNYPIGNVSWEEATAWCRWLTQKERASGAIGPEDKYRLPTDKEWSIAAGPDKYPWGPKWPKIAEMSRLQGYRPTEGDNTAPVGSYAPNAFGLYDMGGNVFEWVQDWYQRLMNDRDVRQEDKRLNEDGGGKTFKVLRGASWIYFDASSLMYSYHFPATPETHGQLFGFRCVFATAEKPSSKAP